MYGRHRFMKMVIFLLLFFGLTGAFSRGKTERAWQAGYYAGIQANSDDGVAPAPSPYQSGYGYYRHGGSFFAPLLLFGAIGLMMMFFMKMMFGFAGMRRFGGRRHGWHGRGKGGRHGWHGQDDAPYEKQPEDIDPEIRQA